jgi:hypothetical protein
MTSFAGLPPIYSCENNQKLLPFNIYTITQGCEVFFPTIKKSSSKGDECIIIINIDQTGYYDTEPVGYLKPKIKTLEDGSLIVYAGVPLSRVTNEVSMLPGSVILAILINDKWNISLFDLSQLTIARINNLVGMVDGTRIDIAGIKLKQTRIDNTLLSHDDAIYITPYVWFSYNDLMFNSLYPPLVFDNKNNSYWSFYLDDLKEDFYTYYQNNQFFGGTKYIRIEINNVLAGKYSFRIRENPGLGTATLEGETIKYDDIGEFHVFNKNGIFEVKLNTLTNRIVVKEVDEKSLPPKISTKSCTLEDRDKIKLLDTKIVQILDNIEKIDKTEKKDKPDNSELYEPPESTINLGTGNLNSFYSLQKDLFYTQAVPFDEANWYYWLGGKDVDFATVEIPVNSDSAIFYKDDDIWTLGSDPFPTIRVYGNTSIKVSLRQPIGNEIATATGKVGEFLGTQFIWSVETVWDNRKPPGIKNNFNAIARPTENDDSGDGYTEGSLWYFGDTIYILTDSTTGKAEWFVIDSDEKKELSNNPVGASPLAATNFKPPNLPEGNFLDPGYYEFKDGEFYGYGDIYSNSIFPITWIYWNNSNADITYYLSGSNPQNINYNFTEQTWGDSIASGQVDAKPGEVWEFIVKKLTPEEIVFYTNKFSLQYPVINLRIATRISTGIFGTLDNFGNWDVIRIAQDINTKGFKPLKIYVLDNLGVGEFKIFSRDKILTDKGLDYPNQADILIEDINYYSVTLPNTRNQYFAYRVSDNLVMWEKGTGTGTATYSGAGIQSGNDLPTDPEIKIYHLVNSVNPDEIDGLYSRDRNGIWVI